MKMKALLWSTLLQYCVLAIFEFHAISSKIELNHYDPNCAVFAKREELLISIGFGREKESGISFCQYILLVCIG